MNRIILLVLFTVFYATVNSRSITSPGCHSSRHYDVYDDVNIDTSNSRVTHLGYHDLPGIAELFVRCTSECCLLCK